MRREFLVVLEAYKSQLTQAEQKVLDIKRSINGLYELDGEAPPYSIVPDSPATTTLTAIKADTFYGKSINTAAREYLEMRKNAGQGPAAPREVYEALSRGGLKFETKDETNAIIGVRATLRKNSSLFHRLPNGDYGLLEWYPNAKAPKEDGPKDRKVKSKKHKKAAHATSKKAEAATTATDGTAKATAPGQTVAKSIENVMHAKGDFMKVPEIVEALTAAGTPLKSMNPVAHVGSVLSRGKQFYSEKGKGWKVRSLADAT